MNSLYIDTSNAREILVKLTVQDKSFEENKQQVRAQEVLPTLENLLSRAQISLHNLQSISVNRGPGSYTGLKVGVAIANALSFSLGIPVNDRQIGKIETPTY